MNISTFKLIDNVYTVNINKINMTKPKINYILIIDNYVLTQYTITTNPFCIIPQNYVNILAKYMNSVNIINFKLITTFPDVSISDLTPNNFFDSIYNIKLNTSSDLSDPILYDSHLCKSITNNIHPNIFTEIMIFTDLNHLNPKLFDNEFPNCSINIITKEFQKSTLNLNNVITLEYQFPEELIDIISSKIYLKEKELINNINISSSQLLFDNNQCINNINDNILLIKSNESNIIININDTQFSIKNNTNDINLTQLNSLIEYMSSYSNEIPYAFTLDDIIKIHKSIQNILQSKKQTKYFCTVNTNFKTFLGTLCNSFIKCHIDHSNDITDKILQSLIVNDVYHKHFELYINNLHNICHIRNIIYYDNLAEFTNSTTFIESNEFFTSIYTMSSWHEEMANNNGMGLLIELETNPETKFGYTAKKCIINVTTTCFPISDYLEKAIEECNDIQQKMIFNGNAIGQSNGIIPLYINKKHWHIVKKYISPLFGIMLCSAPLEYSIK